MSTSKEVLSQDFNKVDQSQTSYGSESIRNKASSIISTPTFLERTKTSRFGFIRGTGLGMLGLTGAAFIGCGSEDETLDGTDVFLGNGTTTVEGTPRQTLSFNIENLPGEQKQIVIGNAEPANLVIRKGGKLDVKGSYNDETGTERVIISISDPLRQNPDGTAVSFLGSLPILQPELDYSLKGSKNSSFSEILTANGGSYDKGQRKVNLRDGKNVSLETVDETSVNQERKKMGVFFIDVDPLKKDKEGIRPLHLKPLVSEPPATIVYKEIKQSSDGRVLAFDSNGAPIARAISQRGGEWRWTKTEHLVNDYSPSELADALDLTMATYFLHQNLNNPRYTETFLEMANKLKIGDPFFNKFLFAQNLNWRKVLDSWDFVKEEFDGGNIPYENEIFSQQYVGKINDLIGLAKKNNLPVIAEGMTFSHGDIIPVLYSENFSIEEKKKMIEFMMRAKMLKFKDIEEWVILSEVASGELWVPGQYKGLYQSLGGRDFIHEHAMVAHETLPNAVLGITEANGIDANYGVEQQTAQRYWDLLAEFKKRGTPITKAGFQLNLWVYAPPTREGIRRDLQKIKDLGYGIVSTEMTVAVSDKYPMNEQRPRTVQSVRDVNAAQAKVAVDALASYIEEDGEFGYYSGTDFDTWYNYRLNHRDSTPELTDNQFRPKQAYLDTREYLKSRLTT